MPATQSLEARDGYLGWPGVGLVGGEVGALGMALTLTLWSWFHGLGFWYPLSLIGSTLLGAGSVSHRFVAGADLSGIVLLAILAAVFGLLFAYAISLTSLAQGVVIALGALFSLVLWVLLIVVVEAALTTSGLQRAPRGMVVCAFLVWGFLLGLAVAVSLARSPHLVDHA
jgi:hypothetical protein